MTDPSTSDRRAFPRKPVSLSATIATGADGESAPATVVDLSLGGALLVTRAKPDGTVDYTLRFNAGDTGVDARLRIVRSGQRNGAYYLGCAFSHVTPELQGLLHQVLDELAAAGESIDTSDILRDLVRTTRYELRTPLNHIIGSTELLQEQALEAGFNEWLPDLEQIRTAARGLLSWLTGSLDLGKVAAGELELSLLGAALDDSIGAINDRCNSLLALAEDNWRDAMPDLTSIHLATEQFTAQLAQVVELSQFRVSEAGAELSPDRALALQAIARLRTAAARAHLAGNPRLLLVDANEASRDLLARRLGRLGYEVSLARDGFEALDRLKTEPADLVLLDVMLPEMSGADVLEAIKADAALAETPVIMLSALDQIEWVARCIELGAEDYLPTPFEPMVLQARIETSLEKRRLRAQEVEYLREVARVTEAAAAVETASFEVTSLNGVAQRQDSLGNLARVFQRMAHEVQLRENALRQQVQQLRIEVDEVKRKQAVDEITETDYFKDLEQQADRLRRSF